MPLEDKNASFRTDLNDMKKLCALVYTLNTQVKSLAGEIRRLRAGCGGKETK